MQKDKFPQPKLSKEFSIKISKNGIELNSKNETSKEFSYKLVSLVLSIVVLLFVVLLLLHFY